MAHLGRFTLIVALALALVGAQSAPALADHASISGTVTDARYGAPVAGVCIQVGIKLEAPCWTYTDSYGRYTVDLTGAPDGSTWQLRFSKKKYVSVLTEAFAVSGPTTRDQVLVRR